MARARVVRDSEERLYGISIKCPGCSGHLMPVHEIPPGEVKSPNAQGKPHWNFNWDLDYPTFSPSIKASSSGYICHSHVRDGKIQFLADSTHKLAGQTVDLPEITSG